jgi:hypothetical protein
LQIIFVTYFTMRSLSLDISWTRLVALVLLPFFTVNILSVSLVTAASGDEYLTGSTEPIVEMVAPDTWIDAALAEQTGSTEYIPTGSGVTAPEEIPVSENQTSSIVSESSGAIESIGSGGLVSTGAVGPVADPIKKSDTENVQEDMVVKIDGDIQVNTGIILEDANNRVTIQIERGTTINTVDADGQEIDGITGQVMVDTSLDQSQRSDIETDTVIAKLEKGTEQALDTAFEIGPIDRHMIFSKPVRVTMDMDPALE